MGVVSFEPGKCSGCWACTMTCVDQNDLKLESTDDAFRLVISLERETAAGYEFSYEMRGCMHCETPGCINACPCDCYSIVENGLVLLNNSRCIGCGLCLDSCRHGAIIMRDSLAIKCDGCAGRVARGLRPACEKICPSGALKFEI